MGRAARLSAWTPDGATGIRWLGQCCLSLAELVEPVDDCGARGASAIGLRIDVQHHVLCGRDDCVGVGAVHRTEQAHAFCVVAQELHGCVERVALSRLGDEIDVTLNREVAHVIREVRAVNTEESQKSVAGLTAQ